MDYSQVAKRWYPKERNSIINNVKSHTYKAPRAKGLTKRAKILIGVIAAVLVGGIIVGVAVGVTQARSGGSAHSLTASSNSSVKSFFVEENLASNETLNVTTTGPTQNLTDGNTIAITLSTAKMSTLTNGDSNITTTTNSTATTTTSNTTSLPNTDTTPNFVPPKPTEFVPVIPVPENQPFPSRPLFSNLIDPTEPIEVDLAVDFVIPGDFNPDLLNNQSAAYGELSKKICGVIRKSAPQTDVANIECTSFVFFNGSTQCKSRSKHKMQKNRGRSEGGYANQMKSAMKRGLKEEFPNVKDVSVKNAGLCKKDRCKNKGKCIELESGDYKCQCKGKWAGKNCDEKLKFCKCTGDPHCTTFDRFKMDYQGTCKFLFAKSSTFQVNLRSIHRNGITKVAYSRYVELEYEGDVIRIGKLDPYDLGEPNGAMVNGVQVDLPFKKEKYEIYRKGKGVECKTTLGVVLKYKKWKVRLGVPEKSFKGKMEGFCGNFDGVKKNDRKTSTGEVVDKSKNFGKIIGDSYVIEGERESQPLSTRCVFPKTSGFPTCSGVDLSEGIKTCGMISDKDGPFKNCINVLHPEEVANSHEWCLVDVKLTCDNALALDALKVFADDCHDADDTSLPEGVFELLANVSLANGLENKTETCQGGAEAVDIGSGCMSTCKGLTANETCGLPDVFDTCMCPSGEVIFNGKCIAKEMCGCSLPDGQSIFLDSSILSADCKLKYKCTPTGEMITTVHTCSKGKSCSQGECSGCKGEKRCKNGGKCVEDDKDGFKCECPIGFISKLCDIENKECKLTGLGHMVTLDGLNMDYHGNRRTILMEAMKGTPDEVTIYAKKLAHRGRTQSGLLKSVEMNLHGEVIEVGLANKNRNKKRRRNSGSSLRVKHNSMEISIPINISGINILMEGSSIKVEALIGVSWKFDKQSNCKIKLPTSWKTKVAGMCGNYDGDKDNDKLLKDGTMANGTTPEEIGKEVGESFVEDDSPSVWIFYESDLSNATIECAPEVLDKVKKMCEQLSSPTSLFKACLEKLPSMEIKQMKEACESDSTHSCEKSFALATLENLNNECAKERIPYVPWRDFFDEPCQCLDPSMECQATASPCIPTCDNVLARENCGLPMLRDLCTCPFGTVLFNGRCVDSLECGCVNSYGAAKELGEIWKSADCLTEYTCKIGGRVEEKAVTCEGNCFERFCYLPSIPGGPYSPQMCNATTCVSGNCVMGEDYSKVCSCAPGFTGPRCDKPFHDCTIYGAGHVSSFDGLDFIYTGTCRYVLAACSDPINLFRVYARNTLRFGSQNTAFLRYVEIDYKQSLVRLGRKEDSNDIVAMVDGLEVATSDGDFEHFTLFQLGNDYVFKSKDSLVQVTYSSSWTASIKIQAISYNPSGLCGNNNGIKEDDNMLFNRSPLNAYSPEGSGQRIGDSSVVLNDPDFPHQNISYCKASATVPGFNFPSINYPPPSFFGPLSSGPSSSGPPSSGPSSSGRPSDPSSPLPPQIPSVTPSDPSFPPITSDCPEDINVVASVLCAEFTSLYGVFETCISNTTNNSSDAPDAAQFAEWCRKDFTDTCDLGVIDLLFSRFAKLCYDHVYTEDPENRDGLLEYRDDLGLPTPCEGNTVFMPIYNKPVHTCETINQILMEPPPTLFDTCVCPQGMVLFGGECVSPNECGVIENNQPHVPGDKWLSNGCALEKSLKMVEERLEVVSRPFSCRPGTLCKNEKCTACEPNLCQNGASCKDIDSDQVFICKCRFGFSGPKCQIKKDYGSCTLFASNLITFDDLFISHKTTCKTILLNASASQMHSISVQFTNEKVHKLWFESSKFSLDIEAGEEGGYNVKKNNDSVFLPFDEEGIKVEEKIGKIVLTDGEDIIITISAASLVLQAESNIFKNQVSGFCGNFDDDMDNDATPLGGTVLSVTDGNLPMDLAKELADSFLHPEQEDPKCVSGSVPPSPPSPRICSFEDQEFAKNCEQITDSDGALSMCLDVYPLSYLEQMKDVCLAGFVEDCSRAYIEQFLDQFVQSCNEDAGQPPASICSLLNIDCGCSLANTVRVSSASACPTTCMQPDPDKIECDQEDLTDVCVCRGDWVLHEGKCISPLECGCYDDQNRFHETGSEWLSEDCTKMLTCQGANEITEEDNECSKTCVAGKCTACKADICGENGDCVDADFGKGYYCVCHNGFQGNGLNCTEINVTTCTFQSNSLGNTFDSQSLSYMGVGKFTLVKSLDESRLFKVSLKNWYRDQNRTSVTPKYVELEFAETSIRLIKLVPFALSPIIPSLNRDGNNLNVPYVSALKDYRISVYGNGLMLETSFGVTVSFKPDLGVKVELSLNYEKDVKGFCGNFDGNMKNDLMVGGRDASNDPDPGNSVGNSHVVNSDNCGRYIEIMGAAPDMVDYFKPMESRRGSGENSIITRRETPLRGDTPSRPFRLPPFNPLDAVPDDSICVENNPISSAFPMTSVCPALDLLKTKCESLGEDGEFGECWKVLGLDQVNAYVESCVSVSSFDCSEDIYHEWYFTLTSMCQEVMDSNDGSEENSKNFEADCLIPFSTFMATTSACPATCSNPSSPESCLLPDAKLVCACEPGRLLFNGQCVVPSECGCVDTLGIAHMVGETWLSDNCDLEFSCEPSNHIVIQEFSCQNNKTCKRGVCEICQTKPCAEGAMCLESKSGFTCRCQLGSSGDTCKIETDEATYSNGYMTTFDGKFYEFKGTGEFLMVQSTKNTLFGDTQLPDAPEDVLLNDFEVYAKNVIDEIDFKKQFVKSTRIIFMGFEIEFGRMFDGPDPEMYCKVDGELVDSYNGSYFTLEQEGTTQVSFSSKKGIFDVLYDATVPFVRVTLPDSFKAPKGLPDTGLTGLGANYDGDESNDLRTKDGEDVSDLEDAGEEVGKSFTNQTDPEFLNPPTPPEDTGENKECKDEVLLKSCELLSARQGAFKDVIAVIEREVQDFEDICTDNMKERCTKEVLCESAEQLFWFGMSKEVSSPGWRRALSCELSCPEGQVFAERATACPTTCFMDNSDNCMETDLINVCVCAPGRVLFKGECVLRNQCGCRDGSNSRDYNIEDTWKSDSCTIENTCGEGGQIYKTLINGCMKGTCVENKCSGCSPNPCENNGECEEGFEEGDFTCKCPVGTFGRTCAGSGDYADVGIVVQDSAGNCPLGDKTAFDLCVKTFYDGVKSYLKKVYDGLSVGPENVKVAFVTFSDTPELQFEMNEHKSIQELKDATDAISFSGSVGSVDLPTVLETALLLMFPPRPAQNIFSEARFESPKVVYFIVNDKATTGDPNSLQGLKDELNDAGIDRAGGGFEAGGDDSVLGDLMNDENDYVENYKAKTPEELISDLGLTDTRETPAPSPSGDSGVLQGECVGRGDPHFITFDGMNIDYQGTCETIMMMGKSNAGNFSVSVHSKNKNGNPQLAAFKSVKVMYAEWELKIAKVGVDMSLILDGEQIGVPFMESRLSVYPTGDTIHLVSVDSFLSLSFSTSGTISIKIPNAWSNKVSGLCGNFDGNANNDLTTMEGIDVSSDSKAHALVGDSFIVDTETSPEECKAPTPIDQTCSKEAGEARWKCMEMKNATGIFADCFAKMDAAEASIFETNCLSDLDLSCDPFSIQITIKEFTSKCFQKYGVKPEDWRKKMDFPPCKCNGGLVCLPTGSPCLHTYPQTACILLDDVDVCTCPPRMVFSNGRCVMPDDFGCADANGNVKEIGETWLSDDCSEILTCKGRNELTSTPHVCPGGGLCVTGKCSGCALIPCGDKAVCLENTVCPSKTTQGCYWKKMVGVKASLIEGKQTKDLAECFETCIFNPACTSFTWVQSTEICGILLIAINSPSPAPPPPTPPPATRATSFTAPATPLPPGLEKDITSTLYTWKCTGESGCDCDKEECGTEGEVPSSFVCRCGMGTIGTDCSEKTGLCKVSNTYKVTTFDSAEFNYRANCQVKMMEYGGGDKPAISVSLEIAKKAEMIEWPKNMHFDYKGKKYTLASRGFGTPDLMVEGERGSSKLSSSFESNDFKLVSFGSRLTFETTEGIKLKMEGSGACSIELPQSYKSKVKGMCGDFDANPDNDLVLSPDAPPEVLLDPVDPGNAIGNSWFIPNTMHSIFNSCAVANAPSFNFQNDTSSSVCQLISNPRGPFGYLLQEVENIDVYVEDCKQQVNETGRNAGACFVFEELSEVSMYLTGAPPNVDWRQALGCPCRCESNLVCAFKASGCMATCESPVASADCPYPDVQYMCVCPTGKVYLDGMCVDTSSCGCLDSEGFPKNLFEEWLSEDCRTAFTCLEGGKIDEKMKTCSEGTKCSSGVCSACAYDDKCQNGGKCVDVAEGGSVCGCKPGTTGPLCENDDIMLCAVFGSTRLLTFDSALISYGGDCKVLLARSIFPKPFFEFSAKAIQITEFAYKLNYVEFSLGSEMIKFQMGGFEQAYAAIEIFVDNKAIELPAKIGVADIQVVKGYPVMNTPFGVRMYFKDSIIHIEIPKEFANSINGMCGNGNGDIEDDFSNADVTVASSDPEASSRTFGRRFADTFILSDPELSNPACVPIDQRPPPIDGFFFPGDNTTNSSSTTTSPGTTSSSGGSPDIPSNCNISQEVLTNQSAVCTSILAPDGLFSECLSKINATTLVFINYKVSFCKEDVFALCDPNVVLLTLEIVAETCAEYEVEVSWPDLLDKAPECPIEGMVFTTEPRSPCSNTCANPEASNSCPIPDQQFFCVCISTHVLNDNRCVPKNSCGCVGRNGQSHSVGAIWFDDGCAAKNVCKGPSTIERTENEGGVCDASCPCACASANNEVRLA